MIKHLVKKIILVSLTAVLVSGCGATNSYIEKQKRKERLVIAEQMFKAHCKTAGVKIYKTAKDVEGIYLMKVRPKRINFGDQFRMDDPYGRDLGGEGYIEMFLQGVKKTPKEAPRQMPAFYGYKFVEARSPKNGRLYRYTGSMKQVEVTSSVIGGGDGRTKNIIPRFVLDSVLLDKPTVRYGVTYEDISTRTDREHWIAGSSLKIIDLQTNEVMAERIGYMMDYGQGSRAGGRSPWLMAANNGCPIHWHRHGAQAQRKQTQRFVEQVLIPREGK